MLIIDVETLLARAVVCPGVKLILDVQHKNHVVAELLYGNQVLDAIKEEGLLVASWHRTTMSFKTISK